MNAIDTIEGQRDDGLRTQLRVATAGSVDDGKSTLIGRLLHDAKTVHDDQWAAMTKASRRYGDGQVNLALLTDGLRAEREQGITIDVAYRYFSTPRRSFVLADTPGHAEFTRNMVTGASVSDVAIVLIDARRGVLEQTQRHIAISALLGVTQLVVAVNKMDLVDWSQDVFDEIVLDVAALVEQLRPGLPLHAIPLSALLGDNVVERSEHTPWYEGEPLLQLLEGLDVDRDEDVGARLGVQWVVRAHGGSDHRGLAGQLSGGALTVGDEVEVVRTGRRSSVAELWVSGRPGEHAEPGDAVSIVLADDVDAGIGDLVVAVTAGRRPRLATEISADLCWMTDTVLTPRSRWIAVHRAGSTAVEVAALAARTDLGSVAVHEVGELRLNDLGRVELRFDEPVALDLYGVHRPGGSFVLVDPSTGDTAGAAMVAEIRA